MSTQLTEERNFFGLFELDEEGTVLYSRIEDGARTDASGDNRKGHNFFKEIVPFENIEEFRRRVTNFVRGAAQADNFIFNCRINGVTMPVRVLLARIRERSDMGQMKSILVHIRKS